MYGNARLFRSMLARWSSILITRALPWLERTGRLKWGLVTFAAAASALPRAEYQRVQLEQLREAFRGEHAAYRIAQRLVRQAHPTFLKGILCNLWMPLWENGEKRREFSEREGFEPPLLGVVSPLKECNLQCVGCYAGAVTGKPAERLDFDAMDRIISELKALGAPFIVISGGEPTHPAMWPILKAVCAKHSDQAFMMYTNGTLIDDAKVRDILELGNLSPAISIEGWREQTDARRSKGAYDRIMAAMDRLRRARALFGFSLTYTSANFPAATDPALIDHLISKGCLYGWYFMYVPVGSDPDMNLVVTPWQRDKIRQFTWDMLREKGMFIADFWNSGAMTRGCIAGGRYLHINNRGDIEPCVFLKFTTHNIHDSSVMDALRSPLFTEIRRGQQEQCNPLTPCQFMDNPHCGRRAVNVSGARASEEGGDGLFHPEMFESLRRWSAEYRERYAEPAWTQSGEYAWFSHVYSPPRWMPPAAEPTTHEQPSEEIEIADKVGARH